MAISFSRPDPSSPTAVAEAAFGTARRGFDQQEVRDFLRMVAAELARLQERERFLERELRAVQQNPPTAAGAGPAIDEESVTRLLGEETARILTIARESATQIKARAEEGAARLLREATDEANRLREEAEVEAARRRSDAQADAESELSMAKQQGRDMVEEARAYRERVLTELGRRRELARQQIDQLIHGRDRLVQAFERARLVAADVVAELTPLSEPSEYVDLTPTTGPVPLTVPAGHLADQSSIGDVRMPGEGELDEDNPFVTDATGPVTLDPPADDAAAETAESAESAHPAESAEAAESAEESEFAETASDADAATELDAGDIAALADAETAAGEDSSPPDVTGDDVTTTVPSAPAEEDETQIGGGAEPGEAQPTSARGDAEAPPSPANVLQFPSPAPPSDEIEDADVSATDVDDLFARLRADRDAASSGAVPQGPGATDAAPDAGDDTLVTEPRAETEHDADADADADAVAVADAGADAVAVDEDDVAEDTPFGLREAAIVSLIVAGARKLKRALADEQNEVLDALRRKEPVRSLDVLVPWESEQSERYASAITPDLLAAAEAGATSVGGTAPVDLGPTGALAPARETLASELVVPLRERLARAVEDADGDNDVVAKKVRGIYREWKTQRIDEQLDDLFRGMYARAAFQAIEPGTRVRWIVDPDGPPSPDCEDNSLAEPVIVGDAFPTGQACPPAHPGCRCLLSTTEG